MADISQQVKPTSWSAFGELNCMRPACVTYSGLVDQ